ncbi:MAG: glycosyltransferase family 39 protein [Acidobacteria bacterium]|nr:glycosyltransferase family 39 protein [Acidobacteriota bacterium]
MRLNSSDSRRWWFSIAAIALVAFMLRMAILWLHTPMITQGDEGEYIELAKQIEQSGDFRTTNFIQRVFQGGEPGQPTAYRSPVLPFFLAAHYLLFGSSQTYPRITLGLISAVTCILIALLGRILGLGAAGLIAASLWAVWPPAVFGPYGADRFYPETLAVFFLVSHIAAVSSLSHTPTTIRAIVAGLLLGLTVLTRGYLLFLLPLTVWHIGSLPLKRSRRLAIISALCAVAVFGSWIIRNWMVMGKPVLTTQTEAFYLGNNAWARGSFNGDIFEMGTKAPQLQALEQKYPNIWQMSEVERSEMWTREAVRCVIDNPSHIVWLLFRKSLVFWAPTQFWSVGFYRWHYLYAIAMAFAPVGILICFRRGHIRAAILLLLPVSGAYAAVLFTYGMDRYRFVMEPFIVLIASIGAIECGRWLGLRAWTDEDGRLRENAATTSKLL